MNTFAWGKTPSPRPLAATRPVLAAVFGALASLPLAGQAGSGSVPPQTVTVGPAEVHPRPAVQIPMPPQALRDVVPAHVMPELPVGPDLLPQPDDRPGNDAFGGAPGAPGDLRFWNNRTVRPRNTSTEAPEPCLSQARDTAFMTGNWFGGLSKDSARTFELIDPYSRFPAVDGGFCCDQRCLYVPGTDITIWYLQYLASTTTNRGSVRVAVSVGRDGLRNDRWHSWVLSPQTFGVPTGRWFDYPDIAFAGNYLYLTSNVFYVASNNYAESIVWRMPLANLRDGSAMSIGFQRSSALGGTGSYRFVQGADNVMYWASHVNTSTLRIYRWGDSVGVAFNDRAVPLWRDGTRNAMAPNGVNWIGRLDRRVQTGYRAGTEYGFLWSCEEDPANSRPWPFIRVARFRTSDHTLIGTQDIFNTTYGVGYPACSVNGRGDKGVVMATGGPGRHVRPVAFIVDQYHPGFNSQDWVSIAVPTNSPPSARWGDYFSCDRHPNHSATFLGTGAYIDTSGVAQTRAVWFSREQDEPAFPQLDVQSTGVTSGVPITVDVADRSGRTNGSTPFNRVYNGRQGYVLTAPDVIASGGVDWVFKEWALRATPTGTLVVQTTDRTMEVADIGVADDLAEARYVRRFRVTVGSLSPSNGVAVAVSARDINGQGNGSTAFTRDYQAGQALTLTAEDRGTANPFQRWRLDGSPQTPGNRVLDLTMNSDHDAVAEYAIYTPGSYAIYGTGCPGTGGNVPSHTGVGVPDVGGTAVWELRHAAANLAGVLYWGTRRIPPLPLNSIGMGTCTLDVHVQAALGVTLDGSGFTRLSLPIPNQRNLIGGTLGTQAALVDPGAPTPLRIVHSNPLGTTIGGAR
ncbi:MAG: hypothetical protein R3F56_08880 [Planctomycetota bacterium]